MAPNPNPCAGPGTAPPNAPAWDGLGRLNTVTSNGATQAYADWSSGMRVQALGSGRPANHRRRLHAVVQGLLYVTARVIRSGREAYLPFGRRCRVLDRLLALQARLYPSCKLPGSSKQGRTKRSSVRKSHPTQIQMKDHSQGQ